MHFSSTSSTALRSALCVEARALGSVLVGAREGDEARVQPPACEPHLVDEARPVGGQRADEEVALRRNQQVGKVLPNHGLQPGAALVLGHRRGASLAGAAGEEERPLAVLTRALDHRLGKEGRGGGRRGKGAVGGNVR